MCNHHNIKKSSKDFDHTLGKKHNNEHIKWSRRSFIQALGLVGGGSVMLGGTPLIASNPSKLGKALAAAETDRILVIIRLKGGNDGLNTIVPVYDYDTYANARPTLRVQEGNLIRLDDNFAMPNFMGNLERMWGDGEMKAIHGVGYPDQSLSHFRGTDIIASAISTSEVETGWLGRYFQEVYPDFRDNPPAAPAAIEINNGDITFEGDDDINYAFSLANPNQLETIAESGLLYPLPNLADCTYAEQLTYLRTVANSTANYSGVIHEAYQNALNSVAYSDDILSRQLAIVARLIKGQLGTKIYMVSLSGFDTHGNQAEDHTNLMTIVSNAVSNFYNDLRIDQIDDRVLTMTVSEFGRRVEENGSAGTDHGTASAVLLFGRGLNGNGFVGEHPSLSNLDGAGNLNYTTDFRDVYHTVLSQWLCVDAQLVSAAFMGNQYKNIDMGFLCGDAPIAGDSLDDSIFHTPIYDETTGDVYVMYIAPTTMHVDVKLYNLLGQYLGTLQNEVVFAGEQRINVKQTLGTRLPTGQYIYKITTLDDKYSKSIIIQ
ncbi:DUF1501 domain-containing protein [Abyssalbus ytuae]|uniref:DUF1501 domain-containing protein n=1 Tax=Abyssalbus ytuae TaxID=2926907 RepID=A0A9E7CTG4_9FLAO|nr:DUF1501 domain-containing protein [Abyssalbus ytuae]UOB16122.1 DUF1501 domain-containing protein [Abyssalbus ytuae]